MKEQYYYRILETIWEHFIARDQIVELYRCFKLCQVSMTRQYCGDSMLI